MNKFERKALGLALAGVVVVAAGRVDARGVQVRIFAGDRFIQTNDLSVGGRTCSVVADQKSKALPGGKLNKAVTLEEELSQGYDTNDLAKPSQTRLTVYLPENVPTEICTCGGHVLLMQAHRLKNGPPPPVAISGDAFYPLLQKLGRKLEWGQRAKEGNVVAYFKAEEKKPSHVATICKAGDPPLVISKDQHQRVYITPIGKVNPKNYIRYEVWDLAWEYFSVQVVAGPIAFASAPKVVPDIIHAGDIVTVSTAFNVTNPPAGALNMEVEAALIDGQGNLVWNAVSKNPSLQRIQVVGGPILTGVETFKTRVAKAGSYSWRITLSAKQSPGLDEAMADYESVTRSVGFTVQERPAFEDFEVSFNPAEIVQGGTGTLVIRYKVKGVPVAPRAALEVTRSAQLTEPVRDPAGGPARMRTREITFRQPVTRLNSSNGEKSCDLEREFTAGGIEGRRTLKMKLSTRLADGRVVEMTREASYEVKSK